MSADFFTILPIASDTIDYLITFFIHMTSLVSKFHVECLYDLSHWVQKLHLGQPHQINNIIILQGLMESDDLDRIANLLILYDAR